MLKNTILLCLILFAELSYTQQASTQYTHLNTTWVAPNTTYPNCNSTLSTLPCLHDTGLVYTPPQGGTAKNTTVLAGITSLNWTPGGFLLCGVWTISNIQNYYDIGSTSSSPKIIPSTPITTTVNISCPLVANPATNLSASPAS